ncbi:hypothetical protein MASR2M78_08350 [Treponema sp.]
MSNIEEKTKDRFHSSASRRVTNRINEVFSSLETLPFLRTRDRTEFRYFRRLFRSACSRIDTRIGKGEIGPWTKRAVETLHEAAGTDYPRNLAATAANGAPRCLAIPAGPVRIGVFIGSFDPFQMTHLETALRFLAHGKRPADLVLVIPEGAYSQIKPGRSDYGYRYDILQRQAMDAFRPFIIPLDLGEGQDTIGIIRRIIALFSGRQVSLTHILGSDMFPLASRWYKQDLDIWLPEADKHEVSFDFGAFVVKRTKSDSIAEEARLARKLGIDVQIDSKPIGTPSSTELRERGIFTIVFPTPEVLEKLEVVFRYGMHRHWLTERGGAEYEI